MKTTEQMARGRRMQSKRGWWIGVASAAVVTGIAGAIVMPTPGLDPMTGVTMVCFLVALEFALNLASVTPTVGIIVAGLFTLITPATAPILMVATALAASRASRSRRVWYTAQIAATPLLAMGMHALLFGAHHELLWLALSFAVLSAFAIVALFSCNVPPVGALHVEPLESATVHGGPVADSMLTKQIQDRIGHELSLAHLEAQRIALGAVEDDDIRLSAESASRRIAAAVREMYAMIDELVAQRPELNEVIEEGIAPTETETSVPAGATSRAAQFHDYIAELTDSGVRIELRSSPAMEELDLPAQDIALSVVKEGVANALRHGGPGEIVVSASYERGDDELQLVVRSPLAQGHRAKLAAPKRGDHGLDLLERELVAGGGSVERIVYGDSFVLLAYVPVTFGISPVRDVESFERAVPVAAESAPSFARRTIRRWMPAKS